MSPKPFVILTACIVLASCASGSPRVIQASVDMPEVRLVGGMATQIEMPESERVQSVVTGNPTLVTAERDGGVVNLLPKGGSGETNLIVRAIDDGGHTNIYQYRLVVQAK